MTRGLIKNPGASIRQRLLNHARQHGDDYQRILTRYAIERLLFRLSQTEGAESYVLKGAMLFVTWPEHVFRPTGDLDLLGQGTSDLAAIAEVFRVVCQVEAPEDGIVFDLASLKVALMREIDKYPGVRLSLNGELAKAIIPVHVDIGFGDHVYPRPERQIFPSLLPDMPAAKILMYPRETVLAEKFEAMIRFGEANGRVRDFYDMWVMIRTFPFDLSSLVEAVAGTLRRRETTVPTEIPTGLDQGFARAVEERGLWSGFLRRNPPTHPPPPFPELQQELRRFFGPVIDGLAWPEGTKGQWDPDRMTWH